MTFIDVVTPFTNDTATGFPGIFLGSGNFHPIPTAPRIGEYIESVDDELRRIADLRSVFSRRYLVLTAESLHD